jgi:hypothetical protein
VRATHDWPKEPTQSCHGMASNRCLLLVTAVWGSQVLGTFITEFGQGRLRCDRMFSTHEGARRVADQLAAIAAHSGFEGWLVSGSSTTYAAE